MNRVRLPATLGGALLCVALLVAVSGTGVAARPGAARIWQAPYTGALVHSGITNPAGCESSTPPEKFNLTTGVVRGTSAVTGSSCASNSSTSGAVQSGEVGLAVAHFTGVHGKHTITVNWTVTASLSMSISGSGCTAATDYAKVYVEAGWVNLSGNATSMLGAAWPGVTHSINTTTSKTYSIHAKPVLSWVASFAAGDNYTIYVIWHWHVSAVVLNPPFSCGASTDLKAAGSAGIGTLTEIRLS